MAITFKNEIHDIIDRETGELIHTESSKSWTHSIKSDKFYMVFLGYIDHQFNLTSDLARKVLIWMCENAVYNTGSVSLNAEKRRKLCEKLNICNAALSKQLSILKKNNLISGKGGEFMINPQIFWKGEMGKRLELLKDVKLRVTFSLDEDSEEQQNSSSE